MPNKALNTKQTSKSSIENFETIEDRLKQIDILEVMLFKLFCPNHKHPKEHLVSI